MSTQKEKAAQKPRDPDFAGADIAMRRAARRARRRAGKTSGSVAVYKNGKIVQEKVGKGVSE